MLENTGQKTNYKYRRYSKLKLYTTQKKQTNQN